MIVKSLSVFSKLFPSEINELLCLVICLCFNTGLKNIIDVLKHKLFPYKVYIYNVYIFLDVRPLVKISNFVCISHILNSTYASYAVLYGGSTGHYDRAL